ncbi:hypothetical protein [Acetonema longum]|uniref:Uncharacterized protein n=1 Tax=Acetonema longum DSM 6540 TaxID=1009370 RepID=F7NKR1_9FIRM|nr:hypothetical protein [Acetonema longum]EGO63365.1 hypothetical protein ALO_13399 [Acetonema longum DSM 6540]
METVVRHTQQTAHSIRSRPATRSITGMVMTLKAVGERVLAMAKAE